MTKANVLIIGAGPAGLFCADELLRAGMRNILLVDMGKPMADRVCPQSPDCDCAVCDILEGEGGAGGFSDGKNTLCLDRGTQMEKLFLPDQAELLCQVDDRITGFGTHGKLWAPTGGTPEAFVGSRFEISSYPLRHVGSDGIRRFITNYGDYLRRAGVDLRTEAEATSLLTHDGRVIGATMKSRDGGDHETLADVTCVATGLQGAPWLEHQLTNLGLRLGRGPAGLGLRLETRYEVLEALFSWFYDFKMIYEHDGTTLRSFCCNRRGFVVNENHRTMGVRNVNGHAFLDDKARSDSSNLAIMAKISPDGVKCPQSFVRTLAASVNGLVGGQTVVQRVVDFVAGRPTAQADLVGSRTKTNHQSRLGVHIGEALPTWLYQAFRSFLLDLDELVEGVLDSESLLYAPEMKYYGYRVPIDVATWRCLGLPGLWVLGNASGYLDSFVSAALTGIIAARDIMESKGGEGSGKDKDKS